MGRTFGFQKQSTSTVRSGCCFTARAVGGAAEDDPVAAASDTAAQSVTNVFTVCVRMSAPGRLSPPPMAPRAYLWSARLAKSGLWG
ncbi:hypothetical protein SAV14893_000450 [Streptomyces avermitilis]|uniref:Uncharacterized protein n=1 Tax=Streptomyces avermitilis TaxID=33903 RepID=A0A4D4LH59_STRAX|nr:hypothetical protein SAVMC3_12400 [Streptomyces avermitilis]GDY60652.1 hypothetical protein SAV14893_000450 [Streptomyces avermitilis]GDY79271.1 hypothetical protein SAV31267_087560 [Streptomyces avermitilis]GDY87897.1 hypothetical protein SAVCW2_70960 [Streptomyces avermitilis]